MYGRAGEEIYNFVQLIHRLEDGQNALREKLIRSKISFVLNWPEIEFEFGNSQLMCFEEEGNPGTWEGYRRRFVDNIGRAFLMLGFGKGRDYSNWKDG